MKAIRDKILGAYMTINAAPIYKVNDKLSVVRWLQAVKPIDLEFISYRDTVCEKFKPENFDELLDRYKEGDKECLKEYLAETNKAITDYILEEIEVITPTLSEETICELCTENMSSMNMVELIELCCYGN